MGNAKSFFATNPQETSQVNLPLYFHQQSYTMVAGTNKVRLQGRLVINLYTCQDFFCCLQRTTYKVGYCLQSRNNLILVVNFYISSNLKGVVALFPSCVIPSDGTVQVWSRHVVSIGEGGTDSK